MTIARLMILWAMVLGAMVAPASAATPAGPAVELTPGADSGPVAPFLRFVRSPDGVVPGRIDEMLARPGERISGPTIHFGPPGARTVAWLRVRNASDDQGSWIFTTGRGSLKYFRLYEWAKGRLSLKVDGTDPRAASDNLRTYQAFSSELVLQPREEKLILIDMLSENSTYMPIRIETYGSFFKDRRANIAMVSGVVLSIAILILLNFLFFSITGHREFVWLAIAQGFFALNTVHSEGYITIFFLADKPLVGVALEEMFKCGFAASMAQFCRSFVRTQVHFPRRDRILKILIAAALVIMAAQPALALYPPAARAALHVGGWLVAVAVALFLPFVGFAAMQQLGRQLWPLFVGWAALALFIVYAAVASMGVFAWLPINWHLAGPVGLFESMMVTLALGLNLKKIQADKLTADANYAASMADRVAISERAARLAEEKAFALATVNSQNALLHASGHDSKQVILALNSAVTALERTGDGDTHRDLTHMLQSSARYLSEIVSTTMSGANIAGSESDFVALGCFRAETLTEPLAMMFKAAFAAKGLTLATAIEGDVAIVSDKALLMRAIANLLSNSHKYTDQGGATIRVERDGETATIAIADTGRGMPANIVARLNDASATRLRGDESVAGTGSGFLAAKRLVETLAGSLRIVRSTPQGTLVEIALPCAFAATTPAAPQDLRAALTHRRLVDFDERTEFEAATVRGAVPREHIVALTYDDTTVTRGRLAESAGMMLIKPLCRELLAHPLLRPRSEQS